MPINPDYIRTVLFGSSTPPSGRVAFLNVRTLGLTGGPTEFAASVVDISTGREVATFTRRVRAGASAEQVVTHLGGFLETQGATAWTGYKTGFIQSKLAAGGGIAIPRTRDVMGMAEQMLGAPGIAGFVGGGKPWVQAHTAAAALGLPQAERLAGAGAGLGHARMAAGIFGALQNVESPVIQEAMRRLGFPGAPQKIYSGLPSLKGFVRRHPFATGAFALGGLVLAGTALKPLSGNDDEYNTIQGMQHGGVAQNLRRHMTDFGSGYRGLVKLPGLLSQLLIKGTGGFTVGRKAFKPYMLKRLAEKGVTNPAIRQAYITEIDRLAVEVAKNPFNKIAVINPAAIKEVAKAKGISYGEHLKGVIRHERFHQAIAEIPGAEAMLAGVGTHDLIPASFMRKMSSSYVNPKKWVEEYFAFAVQEAYRKTPGTLRTAKALSEEFMPAWNLLGMKPKYLDAALPRMAELGDQQLAGILRISRNMSKNFSVMKRINKASISKVVMTRNRMAAAQREANIAMSINALMGGRSHSIPGNKTKI